MFKRKSSIRRLFITNIGVLFIIAFVFICAFSPFDLSFLNKGPIMKGNTKGNNVALQISIDEKSDVPAYIDELKVLNTNATFFFPEDYYNDKAEIINEVINSGNGAGYYVSADKDKSRLSFYIGGGISIPVMSCVSDNNTIQVGTSIDVSKLKTSDDWLKVLNDKLSGDMFINIDADNDIEDLKKIVQIIENKGYTILKMDKML